MKLAFDDFGTGFASLRYLTLFPVTRIKIDRAFIKGVTDDPRSAAIVRSLLSMAQSLGLAVIAEGVETIVQAAFLKNERCDEAQGYLYGRPQSAADFAIRLSVTRLVATFPGAASDDIIITPEEGQANGVAKAGEAPSIPGWTRHRAPNSLIWSMIVSERSAGTLRDDAEVALVDDLAAVIAAGDPAESEARNASLSIVPANFGMHRGRPRTCAKSPRSGRGRDRAGSPRSRVPSSLASAWSGWRAFSGARPISYMWTTLSHGARSDGRRAKISGALLGDVEAVERVEQREAVALREQERFPLAPCRLVRARHHRLDDDDLWPVPLPVAAGEHVGLAAFDIDLEKVDLGRAVPRTEVGERHAGMRTVR